jgi:putative transposase
LRWTLLAGSAEPSQTRGHVITDAFSRRIVGWPVEGHMRTAMVLEALEMARWQRGTRLEGLVAHSDAGSRITSIRYGERLAKLGAVPSIGSVGDSFDNALAETVTDCSRPSRSTDPNRAPWRNIEAVELATLGWVTWYNTQRLHGYLGDLPPAEFKDAYHTQTTDRQLVANQ